MSVQSDAYLSNDHLNKLGGENTLFFFETKKGCWALRDASFLKTIVSGEPQQTSNKIGFIKSTTSQLTIHSFIVKLYHTNSSLTNTTNNNITRTTALFVLHHHHHETRQLVKTRVFEPKAPRSNYQWRCDCGQGRRPGIVGKTVQTMQ